MREHAAAEVQAAEIAETAVVQIGGPLRSLRVDARAIAREEPRQPDEAQGVAAPDAGNPADAEQPPWIDLRHPVAATVDRDDGPQRQQLVADPQLVDPGEEPPVARREDRPGGLEREALDGFAARAPARARLALEDRDGEPAVAKAPTPPRGRRCRPPRRRPWDGNALA